MATPINDRDVLIRAVDRELDPRAGKYINLACTTPIFHIATTGVPFPSTITFEATPVNIAGGTVTFSISSGTLTGAGNTRSLAFADMPGDSATVTVSITDAGQTYTNSVIITKVADGEKGNDGSSTAAPMYATATLYKWSSTQPALPNSSSTWGWNSGANTGYLGSDAWYTSPQANPGTPGVQLWVCQKAITATSGTAQTTVTYSSGASLFAISQNGSNGTKGDKGDQGVAGIKATVARAYKWSNGAAPTATGSAIFTWASNDYDTLPATGWSKTKPTAPALGYTLYEATVNLVDTAGSATTSIDWTTAAIVGISYMATNGQPGSTGASAVIAYTLVDGNSLNVTPNTFAIAGKTKPTTGTWGETRAWTDQPSTPAAGQSVFQSNGIYDGTNTTWGVPYLSSLRVGSLSAISANMGTITAGSMDIGAGNFTVSTTGAVVAKSITIKNTAGDIVLDTSATYQISTTNSSKMIQAGAISNTQIGGNLQSTNWNGNTGTGGTGWLLDRGGNLHANSVALRGAIMSGAYVGYVWPAANTSGFYLGPEGLLLGSATSGGKHFQVTADGNVYSNNFRIENGNVTVTGTINATSGTFSGTLNAASGTLGTITSGTIQSGSSGQRTVINQNGVHVYDGNGTLRVRMGIW